MAARKIVCQVCLPGWRKLVGKYPGEHVAITPGPLREDAICDDCGDRLAKGVSVAAVTVTVGNANYEAWEHHYLTMGAEDEKQIPSPIDARRV